MPQDGPCGTEAVFKKDYVVLWFFVCFGFRVNKVMFVITSSEQVPNAETLGPRNWEAALVTS